MSLKEEIGKFLKEKKWIFVFNTETAKNVWAEWCVRNPELSGVRAVPMERFISWDDFKVRFFRNKDGAKNLESVPPMVRKFFAATLIYENSKKPFLASLIQKKYAKNSSQFTNWISSLLPSLDLWHKKFLEYREKNPLYAPDQEDADYQELYSRYDNFLRSNNFYDPLWSDKEFFPEGNSFVVVGPNLIQDFLDYKPSLEGRPDVVLMNCGMGETVSESGLLQKPLCQKFSDSRTELRRTLLKIRSLSEKEDLSDIALVVPQLDVYQSYIEREAARYCIPVSIRSGRPLSRSNGGRLFRLFKNCLDADFSFESLRALLTNPDLPWKEECNRVIKSLLEEGSRLRCVCNYESGGMKIDIWNEALTRAGDLIELSFYNSIRKYVCAICSSRDFEGINLGWQKFKEKFLEAEKFSFEVDLLVSRCVVLLKELSEEQKKYSLPLGLNIEDPYNFFLAELDSKLYTMQSPNKNALPVYKYKVSSCAPFKYQFVLDASQSNLDSPNRRLSFLSEAKRARFGFSNEDTENDPSASFVASYAEHSNCFFSYAEDSFMGFAISHNALDLSSEKNPWEALDGGDFNKGLEKYFLDDGSPLPKAITGQMKESFERWQAAKRGWFDEEKKYSVEKKVRDSIYDLLVEKRKKSSSNGFINLTQTDLKNFFPCPRKWLLQNVLRAQEENLQSQLSSVFDMGNLNHKILELFFNSYKEKSLPLPVASENGVFADEEKIRKNVLDCVEKSFTCADLDFMRIPLVERTFNLQKEKVSSTIMKFLYEFLGEEKFGGWNVFLTENYLPSVTDGTGDHKWNYTGRFDCILEKAGRYAIVDFKNTPNSIPDAKDIAPNEEGIMKDFQMPLYYTLSHEAFCKEEECVDFAAFAAIQSDSTGKIVFRYAIDATQTGSSETAKRLLPENFVQNNVGALKAYSKKFSEILTNEKLHPNLSDKMTTPSLEDDCKKCAYNSLCRFRYSVSPSKFYSEALGGKND